jgi:hypothetical protein
MLKIPVQLLRNSFWINFIQPGIPLLLWDLLALRKQDPSQVVTAKHLALLVLFHASFLVSEFPKRY